MDEKLIHWYPGHMTKAKRMLKEHLSVVQLVIEVLDARAPLASRNPEFEPLFSGKARVVLLNKADLADERETKKWVARFREKGMFAAAFVALERNQRTKALALIDEAAKPLIERYAQKGVRKTLRAMVVGVPNVGKSAVINAIAGAARAKAGNKPGVTRGKQWIKIHDYCELMDTPGLLWPKLEDQVLARHLAYINAINDDILELEPLSRGLLAELNSLCPEALAARYGEVFKGDTPQAGLLEAVAKSRGFLMRGAEPDTERAARAVLDEFRMGKIAKVTLECAEAEHDEA